MKAAFVSFLISLAWHAFFLFLIVPLSGIGNIPKSVSPEVQFLGRIVESTHMKFLAVKPQKEFLFSDSIFKPEREYLKFSSRYVHVYLPVKRLKFSPLFQEIQGKEFNPPGYIIFTSSPPNNLKAEIEMGQCLNPKLVKVDKLTGDFTSDFKNWFQLKVLEVYSPSGSVIKWSP